MTQPVGPYPFAVQTGPVVAPTPAAVVPAAPAGIDWRAIQEREAQEQNQANAAEDNTQEEAARAALREEIGVVDTLGTQAARGVLDGLLAPGALAGLLAQGAGEAVGSDAFVRFGRDLGRASSGKAAIEALGFIAGGGDTERADRARIQLEKQEEARPTLAMISRLAGTTAFGVGLGGAASAGSKTLATIAANAAEGAAGGAQIAYETLDDAPLRDVITAAAIGSVLGGGLTAAGAGAAAGVRKIGEKVAGGDLDKVFGSIQQFADERMIKTAIGNDKRALRALTNNGRDMGRLNRIAEKMRDADLPNSLDDMDGVVKGHLQKAANELSEVGADLDAAGFKPSAEGLFAKLRDQANELRQSGVGRLHRIADTLESELAPFRDRLAIKQTDQFGNEVVVSYRDPTFTDLRRLKMDMGRAVKFAKRDPSMADDALRDQWALVARELDSVADAAGPEAGAKWRTANRNYHDWKDVSEGIEEEVQRRVANRFVSPSDYGTGIAGGIMMMISSGNPLAAAAAGAATALGHRAIRYAGSKVASSLANRLARTRFHVPLSKAGGPEAQQVAQQVGRARQFMQDTAERAGQNPTVRETASNAAREVAAEAMAKAAGKFDPAAWNKVTPIGKVVHRSEILDRASVDIAQETNRISALRSEIPDALDPVRLNRLLRDADGVEGIGKIQSAAQDILASVPATPAGSAAAREIRETMNALRRANAGEAFSLMHRLGVNIGAIAPETAGSVLDEASANFAQRAVASIRQTLSDPSFGEAGRLYQGLTAVAPEAEPLLDAVAVRSLLVNLAEPGQLTGVARSLAEKIEASHAAASALAGWPKQRATKELAAWEKLIQDGEDVSLIDGKPMASLVDLVQEGPKRINPETEVLETVGKEVNKIVPVLKGTKKRGSRFVPGLVAASALKLSETPEEQREIYTERVDTLARVIAQPETTDLANVQGGTAVAGSMTTKLQQLLADMPKPVETIRGKQALSTDDLRRANAMWEATLEPLSVFQDFAQGTVDYEKVQYAWRQYPGLQQAAQAGVIDLITNDLDDAEREAMPESMLSQLDYLVGFGGKLQPTVDPAFAARMSSLPVQEQKDQPRPGGMLELPGSEPTHTEKIARTL